MQTKFFINLIAQNLFTNYNNNKIKHYFIIIMKINLGLKCYVSQVLDILSVGISIIFIYIILNIINIKLLYYI